MLKQIGNRVSGVSPVNLWRQRWRWRQLYHYNDHRNVDKGVVGAPVCEDIMKPQIKIDDEMRKRMEDYFKGGIPCMSLVAYQPNAKMIVDEKTGEIVKDRKPFFHLPPVRLQYGRMLADDAITAALKDHEAKKTNLSDHSKNAVDAHKCYLCMSCMLDSHKC
ncbi:hypothetical protein R3W88_007372 [Solanum pinnatisectum]|uniref:NIF system FeS cluster assembly NifU N-terminal domain-containing protein n=1 Tax=Solanum pinnatisectum TaxID=50273 RepID=A0AAV9M5L5_9SOLN|nr:hypothetical protein R3W88_007372 [Solanum pinnatisectum]